MEKTGPNYGNRPRMTRENRAKQFLPFAALKGFEDELGKMEKVVFDSMQEEKEKIEEDQFFEL